MELFYSPINSSDADSDFSMKILLLIFIHKILVWGVEFSVTAAITVDTNGVSIFE